MSSLDAFEYDYIKIIKSKLFNMSFQTCMASLVEHETSYLYFLNSFKYVFYYLIYCYLCIYYDYL